MGLGLTKSSNISALSCSYASGDLTMVGSSLKSVCGCLMASRD